MRWKHLKAAARPAVTSVSAALAAAALLTGAVGLAAPATQALAAPAGAHHLGMYRSWAAAQKAAGFRLLMPTRTYERKRNSPIGVSRCEVKNRASRHVVSAIYGLTPNKILWLSQNNSGGACTSPGKVKRLGTYKVDGTKAVLTGKCGLRGLPSCRSVKIFLMLTWTRHGIYYVATSFGLPRKTLHGFATGLHRVG